MSLEVTVFTEDILIMGADTAVSTESAGVRYRVKEDHQKIHVIDDMLIFIAGDTDLSTILIDDFQREGVKTVESLRDLMKKYFYMYGRIRPAFLEKVEKGEGLGIGATIAKYQDGSPAIFKVSSQDDFAIKKVNPPPKGKYCIHTSGYDYKEATRLTYKLIEDQKLSAFEALILTYNELSSETVGGNLSIYSLDGNAIKKVYENSIAEKENLKYVPNDLYFKAPTGTFRKAMFSTAHIIGSDMTLGVGNQVLKAFPQQGIWLGHQNFNDAPFSVDLQGRMKLKNGNNELFIDTVNNNMYLNKMNLIGAGVITGQQLIVHSVIAGEATINDLTVNHLKTMKKEANVGEIVDYQDIKDNFHKFITARVDTKSHAKADNGKPLYWVDANKKYQTFDVTPYPVDAYTFSDVQEKSVKTFLGSGADAKPFEIDGAGDGGAKVVIDGVEYESARAYKLKYNGGVVYRYLSSNYAKERKLEMRDGSFDILVENAEFNSLAKEYNFTLEDAATGAFSIQYKNSPTKIVIGPNGHISIEGEDVDIKAKNKLNLEGNEVTIRSTKLDLIKK
ncbi:hypothetical protein [Paenibacillus elgii]|uniref:hypothetical protein n=1 Tax=Paenibacillus elgii TaxID=189691 RepID=UPI0020401E31|nr:hypothetical protein [Paenibacillus elgii]MCM3271151.1 hypothetical protein [Paenibacillus elgii]